MKVVTRMYELLTDHGLWPLEAAEVLATCESDPAYAVAASCWQDEADGYPSEHLAVLWLVAAAAAVRWIDEHKPLHFARPGLARAAGEGDGRRDGGRDGEGQTTH